MELFDDTLIPHGLIEVWMAALRCPRCDSPALQPVQSFDHAHRLCPSCGRCWRLEHGRLRAVDPITCHGCSARSKRDCIREVGLEFPQFGPHDAMSAT
jgi:hypothetical protein